QYNLLHREPEDEVLAFCERTQTAFLPYFPLASGLLSGKYRAGKRPPRGTRLSSRYERRRAHFSRGRLAKVAALDALAHHEGHTVLDLAFGWLLSHPPVASVIAGASNATQVDANVAAGRWRPGPGILAEVDAVAPR
ncbi:MAG: aldo/keto reductase, partial [Acidimicrobiales bacterium]